MMPKIMKFQQRKKQMKINFI